MLYGEILRASASRRGDAIALIEGERRISWAESLGR